MTATPAPISATLAINEEIARRRAQGVDTVALGFGEANIPVHASLIDRLARHAGRGDYGPVAGAGELLAAAAGYWSRRGAATDPDQVVAGPGSKPLLYAIFQALGGPIILPKPSWVSYAAQNSLLHHETELVATLPGQGGVPDPNRLAAVVQALKKEGRTPSAVLLTIPDNPTGTIAAPETVRRLCSVAEDNDLTIISDEIYLDLIHAPGTPVRTPVSFAPARTIVTTGLSKSLALGGWRIGLARFPQELDGLRRHVISAASEIWSAPAQPIQQVAAWALTEPEELRSHVEASRTLHGVVARAVAEIFSSAGAVVAPPQAGFYLYPDFEPVRDRLVSAGIGTNRELASVLLTRHGVATLPGSAFSDDEDRLTLRVATPMLYGAGDQERGAALASGDPVRLPWIERSLRLLEQAVQALVGQS